VPELPEVELAVRTLREATADRSIVSARALHPAVRRTFAPRHARRVVGRRIARVERRGKHQFLYLDDGSVLHVHFRMSGDWHVTRSSEPLPAHARFVLELDDGARVILVDPRALGVVEWHADGSALPVLGPEATDPALDAAALRSRLAGRRIPIKAALLDQRVIAGVGNIYAAEALWRARIDPRTPSSALDDAALDRLAEAIRETLRIALADPGRYSSGEGTPLDAYDREGEPCRRCGSPIRRIVQSGRSTFYCEACQGEDGPPVTPRTRAGRP
jgi:formamidopyrimidine-DNA glycosylase